MSPSVAYKFNGEGTKMGKRQEQIVVGDVGSTKRPLKLEFGMMRKEFSEKI